MKSTRIAVLAAVSVLTPAAWPASSALANEAVPPAVSALDPAAERRKQGAPVVPAVTGLPERFLAGGEGQEFPVTLDSNGSEVIRDLGVPLV